MTPLPVDRLRSLDLSYVDPHQPSKLLKYFVKTNLAQRTDTIVNPLFGQHCRRWRVIRRRWLLVMGRAERAIPQGLLLLAGPFLQQTFLGRLEGAHRVASVGRREQDSFDGDRRSIRLVRADLPEGQIST